MGIMRRIGADAFAHVQRFSSDWHADTFAGSTVRNITRGVWAFDMFGDAIYFHLGPSVAVTIGAVVLMLWHWPLMGLVFLVGALLYTAVSIHLSLGYVAPIRRVAAESDSRLGGSLADALTCNAVVKSTAAEGREDARLGGRARRLAGEHAARLVRVDPHRRRPERHAARPAGRAGRRRLVAVVARAGERPATSPMS